MSPASANRLELTDEAPEQAQLREEALEGLAERQKRLPCKLFYDERGSQLFQQICELDEYYPTRTELRIMEEHGAEMAQVLGPHCLLVEYGTGSARKARVLLDHLEEPAGYVPVDISREHLIEAAKEISEQHPGLTVLPVCADFTERFTLPEPDTPSDRSVVWFPGSTIGNFGPGAARELLRGVAERCGEGGGLLIGVDLKKDPEVLERAYNDAQGVTAAFNKNILHRLNAELGSDFDPTAFEHRAFWNGDRGRIEMHLVSRKDQRVYLAGRPIDLEAGETIHTENSYKFSLEDFDALARDAGFDVEHVWTDPDDLFSVQYLQVA